MTAWIESSFTIFSTTRLRSPAGASFLCSFSKSLNKRSTVRWSSRSIVMASMSGLPSRNERVETPVTSLFSGFVATAGQQSQDLLVARGREVLVPQADGAHVGWRRLADHRVGHLGQFPARDGRADRHR